MTAGSLRREARQARWMIAPAAAVLAFITLWPLADLAWLSLHRRILLFGESRWVGAANWAALLSDARFASALCTTLVFTGVSVALELVLALPLALLLDRAARARGLLRAAALLPWASPTVVAAKLWAVMFHADYGVLPRIAGHGDVDVLGTPGRALAAVIAVDVWKTTPFMALLLLAGLQSIPDDVVRAARVDGAGPARIFFRITLPLLVPSIVVAVLFRLLDAVRIFDAIWVLTGGGPANSTESLSVYAYKTLLRSGDFGYGATLAAATFLVAAAVTAGWVVLTRRAAEAAR